MYGTRETADHLISLIGQTVDLILNSLVIKSVRIISEDQNVGMMEVIAVNKSGLVMVTVIIVTILSHVAILMVVIANLF